MNLDRSSLRVLIVDDHPTLVWGLERLIGSQAPRMEVVGSAGEPAQALALARRHRPDLVLLDLDLGGHSGLSLLPALAQQGARVLVLTGSREPQALEQALRAGARGVLGKDAPAETVLKALDKVHGGELWVDRQTLGRVLHGLLEVQAPPPHDPERHKQASLTARERKVVQAVAEGRGASNKALAARLFISEHTLRNHLSAIYHKLGVGNRLELYVYAHTHALGAVAPAAPPAPIPPPPRLAA